MKGGRMDDRGPPRRGQRVVFTMFDDFAFFRPELWVGRARKENDMDNERMPPIEQVDDQAAPAEQPPAAAAQRVGGYIDANYYNLGPAIETFSWSDRCTTSSSYPTMVGVAREAPQVAPLVEVRRDRYDQALDHVSSLYEPIYPATVRSGGVAPWYYNADARDGLGNIAGALGVMLTDEHLAHGEIHTAWEIDMGKVSKTFRQMLAPDAYYSEIVERDGERYAEYHLTLSRINSLMNSAAWSKYTRGDQVPWKAFWFDGEKSYSPFFYAYNPDRDPFRYPSDWFAMHPRNSAAQGAEIAKIMRQTQLMGVVKSAVVGKALSGVDVDLDDKRFTAYGSRMARTSYNNDALFKQACAELFSRVIAGNGPFCIISIKCSDGVEDAKLAENLHPTSGMIYQPVPERGGDLMLRPHHEASPRFLSFEQPNDSLRWYGEAAYYSRYLSDMYVGYMISLEPPNGEERKDNTFKFKLYPPYGTIENGFYQARMRLLGIEPGEVSDDYRDANGDMGGDGDYEEDDDDYDDDYDDWNQ